MLRFWRGCSKGGRGVMVGFGDGGGVVDASNT